MSSPKRLRCPVCKKYVSKNPEKHTVRNTKPHHIKCAPAQDVNPIPHKPKKPLDHIPINSMSEQEDSNAMLVFWITVAAAVVVALALWIF